jgi:Arf-GAP/SH3 domain/ANK repeat/PH domain-containing protein
LVVAHLSVCALVSLRQTRKDYITAKYTEKKFVQRKCADEESRLHVLCEAVKTRNILSLIQVYAEGVDLMETIPLANEHVRLITLYSFFI